MKTKYLTILSAAFLLITFTVFPQTGNTASKFVPGMSVAAKWSDGGYYLAVIKASNDGNYEVEYADGTQGSVSEGDMLEIPATVKLTAGDKVIAVWAGAKFYTGTVQEVKPDGAVVKWDDGSEPSLVEFGKIVKN